MKASAMKRSATRQKADDTDTLTIRIPRGLKTMAEEAARARAVTVTALIREALQDALRPVGRTYQHPGLSPSFDGFIKGVADRRVLILVADERSGHRYFFSGVVDPLLSNESLVALRRKHDTPWIIPRRDIVAWFDAAPDVLQTLTLSLSRQGWADRTAAA